MAMAKEKNQPFWRERQALYRTLLTNCFRKGLDGEEIETELRLFREYMEPTGDKAKPKG